MKRFLTAWAVLLSLAVAHEAYGQFGGGQTGVPGAGPQVGPVGGPQVPGQGPQVPSNPAGGGGGGLQGSLLLEDGTSFLLLEDGASHLCFEGGC